VIDSSAVACDNFFFKLKLINYKIILLNKIRTISYIT